MSYRRKQKAAFFFVVEIFLIALIWFAPNATKRVEAGPNDNVSGWAWSETIGWISMSSVNCDANADGLSDGAAGCPAGGTAVPNYGVNVAADGLIGGNAWAETIGWVTFDQSRLAGCPSGTCEARLTTTTGVVTGWARACSGTVNGDCTGGSRTDGWDGWMHLRSDTNGDGTPDSGVVVVGCAWDGYAWGSDVVGWIHFNTVTGTDGACVYPQGGSWAWADLPDANDEVKIPAGTAVGRGPGWISFDCANTTNCATSNYKVSVASNGDLSGFAWSENLGWVSFNTADVGSCPGGACAPKLNKGNGKVAGWARGCSVFVEGCSTSTGTRTLKPDSERGGWEGWISLASDNIGCDKNSNGKIDNNPPAGCPGQAGDPVGSYAVTVSGCAWDGYAWAGDVIGWIRFKSTRYGVNLGSGCVTITADIKGQAPGGQPSDGPVSIPYNSPATISWTSANATSCTVSPTGWSGTSNAGISTGNLDSSLTYTLSCLGVNGSASDSVVVNTAPPSACNDGIDNDGDGLVDAADPGCSIHSSSEANACSDGIDNDSDGKIDYQTAPTADPAGAGDPGCTSLQDNSEQDLPVFIEIKPE